MNYTKIQTDLLKLASKDEQLTEFNYKADDKYFYLVHRHYVVIIPVNEWLLDTDKVFKNKIPINMNLDKLYQESDLEFIKLTNVKETVDKKSLLKFVNSHDQGIFIDEKLFNIFNNDKYDRLYFKGTTPKAPVIIYNDVEECLGIILPVHHLEN